LQIKSRVTLRDYIKKGILPEPTKRGGRALFFKKSDLKNFLENG
jgi:predicted site-specific integrase-resolvase